MSDGKLHSALLVLTLFSVACDESESDAAASGVTSQTTPTPGDPADAPSASNPTASAPGATTSVPTGPGAPSSIPTAMAPGSAPSETQAPVETTPPTASDTAPSTLPSTPAAGGSTSEQAGGSAGTTPGAPAAAGAGGAGGSVSPPDPTECTRESLQGALDAYFEALATADPSGLPLAGDVKFTENGEEMELGSGGLWLDAGAVKHAQTAIDTEECMIATEAVVPEGAGDVPVAVRLRLEAGLLTEIETIVPREGDFILASNPDAIIARDDIIGWNDPVPEAERPTREELISWMDKYFRLFAAGVCDTTADCSRLENGGGNFVCDEGASCSSEDPGPDDENLLPRLILADTERGIGVGFTMFQDQYTDMHMFKRYGGQVYAVHAILAEASGSGWD